jgi:hypothetical protein
MPLQMITQVSALVGKLTLWTLYIISYWTAKRRTSCTVSILECSVWFR